MIRANGSKAFTLLEALLASVLLALVISAALLPFTVGVQNDQAVGRQAEAVALAQDLMEEILAPNDPARKVPGPDAGEGYRRDFDNVDDYHGYVEQPGGIVPSMAQEVDATNTGAPIDPELSRYATVSYIYLTGQDTSAPYNACRVVVAVYAGATELVRLSRVVYGDACE